MICEVCRKNAATVHVTKVVNNVRTELHLCQQCAKERGELQVLSTPSFAFSNVLTGLLQGGSGHGVHLGIPAGAGRKCRTCGLDYSEFTNSGFLGCSDCYSEFAPMLDPLIRRIHGHTRHTGKAPRRAGKAVRFRREIDALRRRLQQFVETEEYEKAAVVRDTIRELEKSAAKIDADASEDVGGDEASKPKGGSGNGGEETV
jgi:protein arginine kinase activator